MTDGDMTDQDDGIFDTKMMAIFRDIFSNRVGAVYRNGCRLAARKANHFVCIFLIKSLRIGPDSRFSFI